MELALAIGFRASETPIAAGGPWWEDGWSPGPALFCVPEHSSGFQSAGSSGSGVLVQNLWVL